MRLFASLSAALCALYLLTGCAGSDARRQQRWAAFEPLRPAPEFRVLADRPLLKFHREGVDQAAGEGATVKPPVYVEPPPVWKSEQLDNLKIDISTSKFFPKRFEQYMIFHAGYQGRLAACALNEKMEEIGRSVVPVNYKAEEAGWVVFEFSGQFAPNEVKVLLVEPLK